LSKPRTSWDLTIKVDIEPVPAARPRVTRQGWSYYPKRYKDFKAEMSKRIRSYFDNPCTPCPAICEAEVEIVCDRPKSTKLPFPKPDVDNYFKAVTDAATGAVWVDDWQIERAAVSKRWANVGEKAHVCLRVKWKK
jgi:Holliday junction resolvase RusA-like endonuclease